MHSAVLLVGGAPGAIQSVTSAFQFPYQRATIVAYPHRDVDKRTFDVGLIDLISGRTAGIPQVLGRGLKCHCMNSAACCLAFISTL